MSKQSIGRESEQKACDYLRRRGYKIIAQNYRSKCGEIDIIAEFNGELVFVEVKSRHSAAYGFPAEAVNYRKQQKIIRTAMCYLMQSGRLDRHCRFDVIEVFLDGDYQVNHIVNAFET